MSERETTFIHEGWKFKLLASQPKIYKVTLPDTTIAMTGSDVTTTIKFPFPFRLLNLRLYHNNANALNIILALIMERGYSIKLLNREGRKEQNFFFSFGEGYEEDQATYLNLVLNSTNGDTVIPEFRIQKLGEIA